MTIGTNLYGDYLVYFEHRTTGTYGVFRLHSNGMDIKITNSGPGSTALEYDVIGGILDFYFFAGSEVDPGEMARQYAEVASLPAEVPYRSFGFISVGLGIRVSIRAAFLFKCEMRLTFVMRTWLISQMLSQNMQLLEFLSKLSGLRLARRFLRSEITYNTSLTTAFQTIYPNAAFSPSILTTSPLTGCAKSYTIFTPSSRDTVFFKYRLVLQSSLPYFIRLNLNKLYCTSAR